MSTAYLVLLILFIVYVPIWIWVWRKPEAALKFHLVKYGPTIMIKTKLGMKTMDRLAKYKRFWGAFGFASKLISAVLFFLMMYMLIFSVLALPERLASGSSIGIEYALAIPGFNPILPLSYGIVALVIAMVVHELGHGIQARVNGMSVDSSGLLYGVVPLGAFVEPNEEQLQKADRKAQIDVYAAGITVNTVVALIAILLMVGACGTATATYGDNPGVYSLDNDSPAYNAGIPVSSIILGISDSEGNLLIGQDVDGNTKGELNIVTDGSRVYLDYHFDPTERYRLTYAMADGRYESEPTQMGSMIRSLVVGGPAEKGGLKPSDFIYSIEVDGEVHLIGGPNDFVNTMNMTRPGQEIIVATVDASNEIEYHNIVLSDNKGIGYLGVTTTLGGMTFTTPDLMMNRATNPFYGASTPYSYVQSLFSFISGPFQGMDPIPDDVKWWYDVPVGDIFWKFVSMMYWLFWLDILLAISNALPTYILDGGFIFQGGVSWLLEKIRYKDAEKREKLTGEITGAVSTVTLLLFAMVIVAMII